MLRLILYIVIAVLILSFFGISLQNVVQSPQAHTNFAFLGELVRNGWTFVTAWVEHEFETLSASLSS